MRRLFRLFLLLPIVLVSGLESWGEEARKPRLGFALGSFNGRDEIRSDGANILNLVNAAGEIEDRFVDPRLDEAVSGTLEIRPAGTAVLSVQLPITDRFAVEASIGYQSTDVGDIELQVAQAGPSPVSTAELEFELFRIDAGELTRVPLQLTGLVAFRPRASLQPYIGGGIGYTFIGFEPSPRFDELSLNMDLSWGLQSQYSSEDNFSLVSSFIGLPARLHGAWVEARDTFEWHLAGGAAYRLNRRWQLFVDLRTTTSSRSLAIGFNGEEGLGRSVPEGTVPVGSEYESAIYGPVHVTRGGLVDADGDGELDTGLYYVQGGRIGFGGFSALFGARYAF